MNTNINIINNRNLNLKHEQIMNMIQNNFLMQITNILIDDNNINNFNMNEKIELISNNDFLIKKLIDINDKLYASVIGNIE
jgi:hypothetical protein